MSEKTPATLTWHLFVDCPHCDELIDLAGPDYDGEGYVPRCLFSNAWDKLDDYEVECNKCGEEFLVLEVRH